MSAGLPSSISSYDLQADSLPICVSTDEETFMGWYEDGVQKSANDIANVTGNVTWVAKFQPVSGSDAVFDLCNGSTDGATPIPLFSGMSINGLPYTISGNKFSMGGSEYYVPRITVECGEKCAAPMAISGTVEGYEVVGTFINAEKLDVDNTDHVETGTFYVHLSANNVVTFTTEGLPVPCAFIHEGKAYTELQLQLPLDTFPCVNVSDTVKTFGVNAFTSSDGSPINLPSQLTAGETYKPQLTALAGSLVGRLVAYVGKDKTPLTGEYNNLSFDNGSFVTLGITGSCRMSRTMYYSKKVEIPDLVGYQGVTSTTSVYVETDTGNELVNDLLDLRTKTGDFWFA